MSANPCIFDATRIPAYAWTRRMGLCGSRQRGFDAVLSYVSPIALAANAALPHAEQEGESAVMATARSIAAFCVTSLDPRGRRPYDPVAQAARRATRTVQRRMVACWRDPEFLGRTAPPSVRRIAVTEERSRSTVHRDMLSQGIAPVRERRIRSLRPVVRRVAAVLDLIVPAYGREAVVRLDELAARVYGGEWSARSTPATRRARVRNALAEIASAGIGLHPVVADGLVAVRRGRRWRSMGRIAEAIALASPRPVPPLPEPPTDPAVEAAREAARDVRAMLYLGLGLHYGRESAAAVWRLGQRSAPVLDLHPLRRLADAVELRRADDGLASAACDLRQRSGLDVRPLRDFLVAAGRLELDGRHGQGIGWSLEGYVEESGYADRARGGEDRDLARLAFVRGMLAALDGCRDWRAALDQAARWIDGKDLPEPIEEAACSPIEDFDDEDDEAEALEIMERFSIEPEGLSHPAYHKGEDCPAEPPDRPPSGPPDGSWTAVPTLPTRF